MLGFNTGLAFLSTVTGVNWLSWISMNNQECKVKPEIADCNSEEPVFYLLVVK